MNLKRTTNRILAAIVLLCAVFLFPRVVVSQQKEKGDKEENDWFSGTITHEKKTVDGKHYFKISTGSRFPNLTRIKAVLYYQKDFPDPINYRVYEDIVRAKRNGEVKVMTLGLERSLWAGHYKVEFEMDPKNQIRKVKKELPKLDKPVVTQKTWFYGTEELLEKQKEEAVERARNDFYQVLELSESLQKHLRSYQELNDIQGWEQWSKTWNEKVQKLRESNNRRPQFDGDFVEFHFVEDRTGYFLQFDIGSLLELHKLADKIIRSDKKTQEQTQKFRREYQKLRKSVSRTLTFLNITIPLGEKKRKVFRKKLDRLTELFGQLKKHVSSGPGEKFQDWKKQVNDHIEKILATSFSVDSGIPDFMYHRLLQISRDLNAYMREVASSESKSGKKFLNVYNRFMDFRNMADAYLRELSK